MGSYGPGFQGIPQVTCQADGALVSGRGTTYATDSQYMFVTLYAADGSIAGAAEGKSPLQFAFPRVADGDYQLIASDDSGEPDTVRNINVSCGYIPPPPPGGGGGTPAPIVCDLALVKVERQPNTNPLATATNNLATGRIAITATTSYPPLKIGLAPGTFDAPNTNIQSGTRQTILDAVGHERGFIGGIYRVYIEDAAGCVINTTVEIADSYGCNIQVEVLQDEDAAFINNLGGGALEYDWTGLGQYSDQRFVAGLKPGPHSVSARDKADPSCRLDLAFSVAPYPRPLKCCFFALSVNDRWRLIDEPVGLDAQDQTIKRDPKLYGVSFEYAEQALSFDCAAGRDLINQQRDQFGDDAQITYLEFERQANGVDIAVTYTGKLNLYDYSDQDGLTSVNVDSSTLATLVKSRLKTATDLSGAVNLDGGQLDLFSRRAVQTSLHSKAIVKVGHYTADGSYGASGEVSDKDGQREPFIVLGFPTAVVDNLKTFYQQQTGFSFLQQRYEFYKADEGGQVTLDFNVEAMAEIYLMKGGFNEVFCELFLQKNDEPAERLVFIHADGLANTVPRFNSNNYGNGYRANGQRRFDMQVGDKLYLYGKLFVEDYDDGSVFKFGFLLDKASFVKVTAATLGPSSLTYMYPVYEALDRSLEIMTGKAGLLRSNLYGRRDSSPRSYPQLGPAGNFVLGSGFMIRGILGKPFAPSFQDLLDGLGPIHCVGMAVQPDALTGEDVVRIETATAFFEDRQALRIDFCEKFIRKADPSRQPNLAIIGYEKWQPDGQVDNALDEPNSVRQWSTPTIYNPLTYTQKSKFIAGQYLLENQRRLGKSDNDGTNDNATFIIAVVNREIQRPVVGWSFYGVTQSITFAWTPGDPIINAGDRVIIQDGPNAGAYTAVLIMPDNTGTFGVPAATSIQVREPLPSPGAPAGATVVIGVGYQAERDENFAKVENLYSPPSSYNLRITPARMLRWHGAILNAGGKGKGPLELYRNTYGEGNLKLVTRLIGETLDVAESGDVARKDLADLSLTPYMPEILQFKAYLDKDGFRQLRNNRHGYIAVFDGNTWYSGFILSVKWKRAKNSAQFELLRRAAPYDPTAPNLLVEYTEQEHNETEYN